MSHFPKPNTESRRCIIKAVFVFIALTALFSNINSKSVQAQITAHWTGGIGLWNDPTNWSTTDFPHNNGSDFYYVIVAGGGNQITSSGVKSIDSLTLGAGSIIDIDNNSEITIVRDDSRGLSGVLFNAGLIRLNATTLGSSLRFSGEVTLSGGGTIALGNDAGNQLVGNNNGRLINLDNLIIGSGTIGTAGTLQLINHASVVANQTIPLHILLSQTATNTGLFQATNSATLNIDNGAIENHGGVIEALNDSIVNLNNATIRGGMLRTLGTGKFNVNTAIWDSSIDQVTVDASVDVLNNRTLSVIGDLVNLQDINLVADTLASTMSINGTVLLSGAGVINLGNDAGNQITGANSGHLINSDHLIRGSGTIGTSNTLQLTNQNTIQADQSIALNVIGSSGVTNDGILRAVSGATLNLTGGIFENANGLIQAQANSTVNLSGLTIRGGLLQTTGNGVFNAAATILDGTSTSITLDGQLNVDNNQTLTVKGALSNLSNTINLNATTVASTLAINGDVDLNGGGTIALGNDAGNQIVGTAGGHLNNIDNLIRGSGTIGTSNTLQLTNQHIIQADQAIDLNIIAGQGLLNQGTLSAVGGATLNLTGGVIDNAAGLIQVQNGSTVNLTSMTVQGGLLQSIGTGQFHASATTLDGSLNAVTLDGQLNIANNQTVTAKGHLTNIANTINLNATTVSTTFAISGAVTLDGGGVIALGNDAGNQITGTAAGHLINIDNLIRGSGTIGTSNSLTLTNHHFIQADQTIGLTVQGAPGVVNFGIMRAVSAATLTLNGGVFQNSLGTIHAEDLSTVNLTNTTIASGSVLATGSGAIIGNNFILDGSVQDVLLAGQVNLLNNQAATIRGNLNHTSGSINLEATSVTTSLRIDGLVNLFGGGSIHLGNDAGNQIVGVNAGHLINENQIFGAGNVGANSLQLTNRGLIQANSTIGLTIDPTAAGFFNDTLGTLRSSGSGGMLLTGGNFSNFGLIEVASSSAINVASSGNLHNQGSVNVLENGSLSVTGTYLQSNGVSDIDGVLSSTILNNFSGGYLTGNGDILGDTFIGSTATLSPGHSAGILSFADQLDIAGTFQVDLQGLLVDGNLQDLGIVNRGTDPFATDFDQANVFDLAILHDGMVIDIDLLAGFDVEVGDFFDILTADSIDLLGTINFNLDDAGNATFATSVHRLFDPLSGTDRDVLRLTALTESIPEPSMGFVLWVGLLAGTAIRRKRSMIRRFKFQETCCD